jgi:hypothetical protein
MDIVVAVVIFASAVFLGYSFKRYFDTLPSRANEIPLQHIPEICNEQILSPLGERNFSSPFGDIRNDITVPDVC